MNDAAPRSLPHHRVPPPRIRAGEAEIDLSAREVLNGPDVRRLEPRAAAVLSALMAAGGEVVSREALLDACWGEDGGSDEALTQAIAQLRRAFGDDPRRPRFIGTVHKAGYRWLARARPPVPIQVQVPDPAPPEAPALPWIRALPWRLAAAVGAVAVLGAAAGAAALTAALAGPLAGSLAGPRMEIETEDVAVHDGQTVRTVAYYNGPRDKVRAAMRRNGAKR